MTDSFMPVELPFVFHSGGTPLFGRFLLPDADLGARRPCVVVTGSWLTVKEQMPLVYARRLAALGYAAFIFDFSGFGESHGEPRQAEIPQRKMDDMAAAWAFVRSFSFVDPERVGHLAICASAQYALAALARGAPVRAFASVAGWYHDARSVAPFYGAAEGVAMRLGRAREALEHYARTREVRTVPAFDDGNDRAGMFFPVPYYAERSRGAVPAWRNEMAEMSWLYWLSFDGLSAAGHVATATLVFHSDSCVLPDHARLVHARLRGPKELAWSEGNQVDFYDLPDHVDRAMAAVGPWFERTLRG